MALFFRKIKRKIRYGADQGKEKYFAVAKTVGLTALSKLCALISERSSLSSADVKGVLDSLNWVLRNELDNGRVVQLGELGNFRLSLSSEGTEEEKDLSAHNIRKARVIFTPGAELRDTCDKVNFALYDDKEKEKECDKQHFA